MRRLMFFAGGMLAGAAIGVTIALLFTPASGDEMRTDARRRIDDVMDDARHAADTKQRELEAELARMTAPVLG